MKLFQRVAMCALFAAGAAQAQVYNFPTYGDCVQFLVESYQMPVNNAVNACKGGVRKDCLETATLRWSSWNFPVQTVVNNSVRDCRGEVQGGCVNFVEAKLLEQNQIPRNAWNNAVYMCRSLVQTDCMEYVYGLHSGVMPQQALQNAQWACGGGTRADCLRYTSETLRMPWNNAVYACRP